jgi:Transposase DDE domain
MPRMTRLPTAVARLFAPLKPHFRHRHYLILCWLVVAHLLCCEKARLPALARHTPTRVAAWHLRRVLAADYWPWAMVLAWLVEQTLSAFPPPRDGVLYLVADSTLKGKRTHKNPWAKPWRLNEHEPYSFGLQAVVLLAQWEVYRIPLAFRLVRRKGTPGYQSEQVLFRQMLNELVLPRWCSKVIVVADAAYASHENLRAIQAHHWWFVIAFPRSWKFTDGHSLRDLVAHLPHVYYRKVRLPLIGSRARYRVFWTLAKRTALREVGDVTVVLSRRRRNHSPKNTKVLVTNLPQATAHQTAAIYLRRWPVELFFKEWKEVVGVGQHQVTKDAARVERSVAVTLMAYLVLLRVQAQDIRPGQPWSAFALKHHFAWEVSAQHFKRCAQQQARREMKLRLAA